MRAREFWDDLTVITDSIRSEKIDHIHFGVDGYVAETDPRLTRIETPINAEVDDTPSPHNPQW